MIFCTIIETFQPRNSGSFDSASILALPGLVEKNVWSDKDTINNVAFPKAAIIA